VPGITLDAGERALWRRLERVQKPRTRPSLAVNTIGPGSSFRGLGRNPGCSDTLDLG
jgi:hypothetical protein